MTIETIKDILDWTRDLHRELADVYRANSDASKDERTKMLLRYVADHEMRLADAVAHHEKDPSVQLIDTWVQDYVQKNPFMQGMMGAFKLAGMNYDQILTPTVQAHQHLIGLYEELAENAKTDRLKELFENMQSLEQHELMRMVHTTERFNDL